MLCLRRLLTLWPPYLNKPPKSMTPAEQYKLEELRREARWLFYVAAAGVIIIAVLALLL